MEHRDVFLLDVIVEYCNQILTSVKDLQYANFASNLDIRDACALRALQIGENANNLSDSLKESHPEIKWHEIVGLRNVIAHEYGDIDNEVLWEIVTIDIPELRDKCVKLLH